MQHARQRRAHDQKNPLILKDVPGKGRGVFADRAYRSGEEVLEFLGERRDVATFADLTHALQVGPRTFLSASGDVDDYVNHSCQPNCGIREIDGCVVLFAFKAIAIDEEITFDYSTTQAGGFWEMTCDCGSNSCRRHIGDFKDLPKALRKRYIALHAVLPFVLD